MSFIETERRMEELAAMGLRSCRFFLSHPVAVRFVVSWHVEKMFDAAKDAKIAKGRNSVEEVAADAEDE